MASANLPNTKRILIDKANTRVVVVASIAAFLVVFSLVAAKSLLSQASYQNRVISAKRVAVKQLKADKTAVSSLQQSYQVFVNSSTNVIGGSSNGTGAQDGNNANIILDALPSKYDFPAMTTSLEKLITLDQMQIQSISGTDDEIAQSTNLGGANPQPVAMPFEMSVQGSYPSFQVLVAEFEHSIRPFQLQTITITSGDNNTVTADITAQTFYQPGKTFGITKKEIK